MQLRINVLLYAMHQQQGIYLARDGQKADAPIVAGLCSGPLFVQGGDESCLKYNTIFSAPRGRSPLVK
jgi:hypothetical protein